MARRSARPANPAKKEDFNFIKVIGVGSYGKVYLVKHRENERHFAMKVIKKALVFRTMQDEGIKGKCYTGNAASNFCAQLSGTS